ncbi:MAG: hypothetical protein N2258_06685 [Brevinematales bacterium]|nr:hypothetical protein [Brevinematales bacterium]
MGGFGIDFVKHDIRYDSRELFDFFIERHGLYIGIKVLSRKNSNKEDDNDKSMVD